MKLSDHRLLQGAMVALAAIAVHGHAEAAKGLKVFTADAVISLADVPGWVPEQTPADFLDGIGTRVKVRWRQLYRSSTTPPPSMVRPVSALTLGSLIADSFLALEANDSQRFRDNNQDVLSYCRVLGLGDKLSPRLMSQGKLAEMEKWSDLRQEVVDGHQELCRVLREQRDEDLAVLVDLGAWLRLLEMVTTAVIDGGDQRTWPLAVGSPALLKDLNSKFHQLTETTRKLERISQLGEHLDILCRHWDNNDPPSPERMTRTREKLEAMMRKMGK